MYRISSFPHHLAHLKSLSLVDLGFPVLFFWCIPLLYRENFVAWHTTFTLTICTHFPVALGMCPLTLLGLRVDDRKAMCLSSPFLDKRRFKPLRLHFWSFLFTLWLMMSVRETDRIITIKYDFAPSAKQRWTGLCQVICFSAFSTVIKGKRTCKSLTGKIFTYRNHVTYLTQYTRIRYRQ